MADHTGIEWADATWNPIVGGSIVSPGCTNCYAMGQAARIERMQPASHYAGTTQPSKAGAVWSGKLKVAPEHVFTQPLHWRRPRRIFVNSMGDLFHEDAPDHWIDRVFAIMALAPQHTFMVLTKRSARMRQYLTEDRRHWRCLSVDGLFPQRTDASRQARDRLARLTAPGMPAPLENVWLGVSTEDQRRADERVPDLLATPAAIRFVSAEPLLGPIDLLRIPMPEIRYETGIHYQDVLRAGSWSPKPFFRPSQPGEPQKFFTNHSDTEKLDLVIVGGESGPKARPMHPDWARSLRDQCAAAGTAFFFKQWGCWAPLTKARPASVSSIPNVAWPDGTLQPGRAEDHGGEGIQMFRATKDIAGRLLDGVEHNAMPEARP